MIKIELKDYSDYVAYINYIYTNTQYIEYVVLENDDNKIKNIMNYFSKNNIRSKNVTSWKGTTSSVRRNQLYKFYADDEFKNILLNFENFFIIEKKEIPNNLIACKLRETSWGISDIAFYDKKGEVVSFVIAHEGEVLVSPKYINKLKHLIINDDNYIFGLR